MSALSELLNSQPVSARQAADRAQERGVRLPYGTIAAYWAGGHGRPSAATLDKLAQVLPTVTIDQLKEAAWNATAAELGDYQPPSDARFLDRRQRRAVDELIRSIVATRGATDAERTDRPDPPASPQGATDQASPRQKTKQVRHLADANSKPQDLTANAHPHGPDRWPDGQPVYDEHWDQWKAWQEAGAPENLWEAFLALEPQKAYDLAARFIPGPTDKERMTTAQDQAAEAPDADGDETGA